ncbi:MAG: hypothetical protein LWY06_07695 [Firmicutes bacterium]|nr:hypothetical protein [Bacillota bacterium]
MSINSINNFSSIPERSISAKPAETVSTEQTASSASDSYKPSENQEKGFVEKVVDGITGFVEDCIIGPAGDFKKKVTSDFGTAAMTAGGLVGGAAGAYLGYDAAIKEAANMKSETLTWQEPVMQSKNLGGIPSDYFSWSTFDFHSEKFDANGRLMGDSQVYRDVPVFNQDGTVRMHDVTETIDSKRFGVFGGVSMGVIIGTTAGVLGGLAVSLIKKIVDGKEA